MDEDVEHLRNLVNWGLERWVEIVGTGVTVLESGAHLISLGGGFSAYSNSKELAETQGLEDTPITTYMVLLDKFRSFAASRNYTALQILEDPEGVAESMRSLGEVLEHLADPIAEMLVEEFRSGLRDAAQRCGLEGTVEAAIKSSAHLAYIRRDAFLGSQFLSRHTFEKGRRGGKLKYNTKILKFWNVNSALRAAKYQPVDAISMCLIRDPEVLSSYFIFLIRDGDFISIWTDANQGCHPLQKYFTRARGNERRYEDRAFKLRFPYQLFELKFDDEGKFRGEDHGNALVPIEVLGVPVADISELPSDQALWAMLMFGLIAASDVHAEEQSYVAEALLPVALQSHAIAIPGQVIVPEITTKDLETFDHDPLNAHGRWRHNPVGHNQWLVDRYADQVPEGLLNAIGWHSEDRLLLTDGEVSSKKDVAPVVTYPKRRSRLDDDFKKRANEVALLDGRGVLRYNRALSALEPDRFGSMEQMQADREWMARYNQAAYVNRLAKQEFYERKDKIARWFYRRLKKNEVVILAAMAAGVWPVAIVKRQGSFGVTAKDLEIDEPEPYDMVRKQAYKYGEHFGHPTFRMMGHESGFGDWDFWFSRRSCYVDPDRTATVFTHFQPKTAQHLSLLTGVAVKKLPDVLQHWDLIDYYSGNHLLSRIDPAEFVIDNPWKTLKFDVMTGVSKRAYDQLRKKLALPKRTADQLDDPPDYWHY